MKELKQINPVLRIKAAVFAAMFIFIPVLFMFSLEVDEAELTVSNPEQVEFTNYTGPHTVINTLKEIQDIGKSMAAQAKAGSNPARYGSKYTVIHVVSAAESGKFDADIFILEPDAGVDHIRNLRMILSGYLEDFYAYSFEDAFLLAQFITIYNAVNRSNMAYFAEKYKAAVVGYLVPEKAGLSTYYADWPGKTMMLIPLTEKADTGGIGSLSSDEISEPKVVEELRKQEDKGIPSREDLIDLKERELDQERKDIEKAKQELEAQKKDEPKRPADTVLAAAEKKPPAVSDIPASGTKPGDAGKPAAEKPPAAKTGEPAAAEKPSAGTPPAAALTEPAKAAGGGEDKTVSPEDKIAEREKALADREEKIREERQQVAEDKKKVIEEEGTAVAAVTPEKPSATVPAAAKPGFAILTFMLVKEKKNGLPLYSLTLIEEETGTLLATADIRTIFQNKYLVINGDILIVGSNAAAETAYFLFLDGKTLAPKNEGKVPLFPNTSIALSRNLLFAVTRQDNQWKLGKFSLDLNLISVFEAPVEPYTSILVSNNLIYVQAENGAVVSFALD